MRKYLIILFFLPLLVMGQGMVMLDYPHINPWLTGYVYRKVITVKQTNIGSALTDFPVYVKTDATIMGVLVDQTNFHDIRFTDTLNNVLNYEKEYASATVGNYWVKTSLSATSNHPTKIYCYYKNATAQTNGSNATGTWNSGFKGIYHFNNVVSDATTTHNGSATDISYAAGVSNNCASFNGSSSRITFSTFIFPKGAKTISLWLKSSTLGGAIFDENYGWNGATGNSLYYVAGYGVDRLVYTLDNSTNAYGIYSYVAFNVNDGNWHYVTFTWDGSTTANHVITYIDGGNSVTVTSSITETLDPSANTQIGCLINPTNYYTGLLDEIRISNTPRSSDWIKFEFNNINSTDQELIWSAIQTR